MAPSLPVVPDAQIAQINAGHAHWLFGPRTGSKSADFRIPATLAPGPLQAVLDVRVSQSESLRPLLRPAATFDGVRGQGRSWRDHLEPGPGVEVTAAFDDGVPAVVQAGRVRMTTACFDAALQRAVLERCVRDAGIEVLTLPEGACLRHGGNVRFAFNYGEMAWRVPAPEGAHFLLGGRETGPSDVAAWIDTH